MKKIYNFMMDHFEVLIITFTVLIMFGALITTT